MRVGMCHLTSAGIPTSILVAGMLQSHIRAACLSQHDGSQLPTGPVNASWCLEACIHSCTCCAQLEKAAIMEVSTHLPWCLYCSRLRERITELQSDLAERDEQVDSLQARCMQLASTSHVSLHNCSQCDSAAILQGFYSLQLVYLLCLCVCL